MTVYHINDEDILDEEPCLKVIPFKKHTHEQIDMIADMLTRLGYKVSKEFCKRPCKHREQLWEGTDD